MNMISQELKRRVLHPAMHRKILLRAAELVEQGWTRGTAARAADGLKVRSMSPAATSWCVVGAVDRALYELLNIDVYGLLDLDVASYDTASCPAGVMSELRRPLRQMLGRPSVAGWNDHVCPGQAAAAQLLRDTARWVDLGADEAATTRSL